MSEQEIYIEAVNRQDPAERRRFLDEACAGNEVLRGRIETLIRQAEQLGSFLENSPQPLGATADISIAVEKPGTQIGPYKLLQQIGEGGMGVVYMAEQAEPIARRVALKIIKPGMDTRQVIARFEAERQALAMMDHVNIARVLDAGTTESGRPYFVMELVHGVPITKYCDDNHLTPRERLELFVPVCQAIQHAHQKGIIHRDIKPTNVMVTLYDGQPVPKVIDFGVAKAIEQKLTQRTLFTQYGTLVGTLEYMSPEQAEMSALGADTRSDIFSLGVLLYELLTGSTPLFHERFKEAAYAEVLRMIKEEEPPKPSTRLSDSGEALASISAQRQMEPAKLMKLVRGELDWIVMKCLDKDRNRRYDTANGLAADVQRYLNDEAVQACPPSMGYRFRKFARRNKATLLAGSVIALAVLLGAGVSTWQAIRATDERDRALQAERKASAEKETTQAAFGFLWHDVLAQASPFREPDRDLKVRTLLERVDARLEKGSGQPVLVEAAVRRMIGELYSDLGETTKARRYLEQSLSVQRREVGEEDPQTLAAMHSLGVCLFILDQDDEAAILLGRALELRRRVLGNEHDDTLLTMRSLGECYTAFQDRYEEAERLLRQALEIRSRVFGEKHRETPYTMHLLADVLGRRGKLKEAEVLGARCVELSRQVFGDDDFLTQWAVHSLARTHVAKNDAARAEPLAVEAVKSSRRIVGDLHPTTHSAIAVLAYTYQLQEKHAESAPLIAELLREPRNDESGLPRHYVIWGLRLHGKRLLTEKKYTEAESALRECLALGKNRVPQESEYWRTLSLLGASLLGQNKYAEAQPLLLESTQRLKQLVETQGAALRPLDMRYLTEALERMAQLYDTWGNKDAAAKWRNELEVLKKSKDR